MLPASKRIVRFIAEALAPLRRLSIAGGRLKLADPNKQKLEHRRIDRSFELDATVMAVDPAYLSFQGVETFEFGPNSIADLRAFDEFDFAAGGRQVEHAALELLAPSTAERNLSLDRYTLVTPRFLRPRGLERFRRKAQAGDFPVAPADLSVELSQPRDGQFDPRPRQEGYRDLHPAAIVGKIENRQIDSRTVVEQRECRQRDRMARIAPRGFCIPFDRGLGFRSSRLHGIAPTTVG